MNRVVCSKEVLNFNTFFQEVSWPPKVISPKFSVWWCWNEIISLKFLSYSPFCIFIDFHLISFRLYFCNRFKLAAMRINCLFCTGKWISFYHSICHIQWMQGDLHSLACIKKGISMRDDLRRQRYQSASEQYLHTHTYILSVFVVCKDPHTHTH